MLRSSKLVIGVSFFFENITFVGIMKYNTSDSQSEILANLLGLTSVKEVGYSEFEGFLKAEIMLTEALSSRTKFNVKYI